MRPPLAQGLCLCLVPPCSFFLCILWLLPNTISELRTEVDVSRTTWFHCTSCLVFVRAVLPVVCGMPPIPLPFLQLWRIPVVWMSIFQYWSLWHCNIASFPFRVCYRGLSTPGSCLRDIGCERSSHQRMFCLGCSRHLLLRYRALPHLLCLLSCGRMSHPLEVWAVARWQHPCILRIACWLLDLSLGCVLTIQILLFCRIMSDSVNF